MLLTARLRAETMSVRHAIILMLLQPRIDTTPKTPNVFFEHPADIIDVTKPALRRHILQVAALPSQHRLGLVDPDLFDIGIQTASAILAESPGEMARREVEMLGQAVSVHGVVTLLLDIVTDLLAQVIPAWMRQRRRLQVLPDLGH
jgi:hypothetical protein